MIQQLIASIRALAPSPRALSPLLLALLVAVPAAVPAQASIGPSAAPAWNAGAIAADMEEGESEEEDEEEETEVELEFEESEAVGEERTLPEECRLRSAAPQVVADFDRGETRLSLRYTSGSSLRIGVSYWLKGAKGTLRLGSASRRIGRRGVIALSRRLDERSLAKLQAARTIVVQLDVPDTPRLCRRYLTMRLFPMRPSGNGATRYEPA